MLFEIPDCPTPLMVGDGFCNDETNNPECNYDGGDCCGSCVLTKHCIYCQCLGGETNIPNALIGNGFCNIEANNAECNYDGGDCCGPDISCKYQLIRVEIKRK